MTCADVLLLIVAAGFLFCTGCTAHDVVLLPACLWKCEGATQ